MSGMMLRRLLPCALLALAVTACTKSEAPAPKKADAPASDAPATTQAATPDRIAPQSDELKQLAFIPALRERAWDGRNFTWGAEIAMQDEWKQTRPFNPDIPIPELAVQPEHYILTPPAPPAPTAEDQAKLDQEAREASEVKDRDGGRSGDTKEERAREKAEMQRRRGVSAPPPTAADWTPVPIPEGTFGVKLQAFSYEAEELTLTGYGAIPQSVGTAPILILLHGHYPQDRYGVPDLVREAAFFAARGYLTLVPNYRNYGASTPVADPPELLRLGMLRDAANLVQALRASPLANGDAARIGLMGFGHGASLAMKTGILMHPRAVFVVSPMGMQEANQRDIFANGLDPEVANSMDYFYGKPDNPETIKWYRNMTYSNFMGDLGCPVGIVAGELNPVVPVDDVRSLMAIITPIGLQALMSSFPRVGHDFYAQDWVGMMQTADGFLKQHLQPPLGAG